MNKKDIITGSIFTLISGFMLGSCYQSVQCHHYNACLGMKPFFDLLYVMGEKYILLTIPYITLWVLLLIVGMGYILMGLGFGE